MTRIHRKSGPLTREAVKDQITSLLTQLRPAQTDEDRAYLEHDKQCIVEDFDLENDDELRAYVMNYEPQHREAKGGR